jgi:hypothetical protein
LINQKYFDNIVKMSSTAKDDGDDNNIPLNPLTEPDGFLSSPFFHGVHNNNNNDNITCKRLEIK